MIDFGASIKEEKEFHKANAVVKILFCAICAIIVQRFIALPILLLIQWIVFDIALNIFLKKDNFLYVGETAKTDKLLRKYLGDYAGLIKTLVVASVILVINFFL